MAQILVAWEERWRLRQDRGRGDKAPDTSPPSPGLQPPRGSEATEATIETCSDHQGRQPPPGSGLKLPSGCGALTRATYAMDAWVEVTMEA